MFNDITVKLPEIVLRLANHMAFRGLMDGQSTEIIRENILYELSLLGAVVTERGPGLWHVRDAESGETCLLSEEEGNYHVEYINHTDSTAAERATSSSGDGAGMETESVREISEHLPRGDDGGDERTSGDNRYYIGGATGDIDQGVGGREREPEGSHPFGNYENEFQAGDVSSTGGEDSIGYGESFPGDNESLETDSGSNRSDAIGDTKGYSSSDADDGFENEAISVENGWNNVSDHDNHFHGGDLPHEGNELATNDFKSGGYSENGSSEEGVSQYECSDCGKQEGIGGEERGGADGGDAEKQDDDRYKGYREQSERNDSKPEGDSGTSEGTSGNSGEIPLSAASGEYGRDLRRDSGRSDAFYYGGSDIHSSEGLKENHISPDEEELLELAVEKRIKRAELYAMEMELLQQRKIKKELGRKLNELKEITEKHNEEFDSVARNLSEIKEIENEEKQKLHLFCSELDSVRSQIDALREKLLNLSDNNHFE